MKAKEAYGLPDSLQGLSFADAAKKIEKMFVGRHALPDERVKRTFMKRLADAQQVAQERQQVANQRTTQLGYGGWGGELVDENGNPIVTTQNYFQANPTGGNEVVPVTNPLNLGENQLQTSPYSWNVTPTSQSVTKQQSWWKRNDGANTTNLLSGVGAGIAALAPMIANRMAKKSLTKPKPLQPYLMDENVQGHFVNRQQLLRNADEQAASQRYFIGQSGGNLAQRSAMLANLNANKLYSTGNLMLQSDMADSEEKKRVDQLKMTIQQRNLAERARVDDANLQNQTAYESQMARFTEATGANFGNLGMTLFNLMQAKAFGKEMEKTKQLYALQNKDRYSREHV